MDKLVRRIIVPLLFVICIVFIITAFPHRARTGLVIILPVFILNVLLTIVDGAINRKFYAIAINAVIASIQVSMLYSSPSIESDFLVSILAYGWAFSFPVHTIYLMLTIYGVLHKRR